jgi:tripartite-type tricarboxylate transporter receptor subunit TctC
VPTVTEQGMPGIDALAWWGLLAPARVPEAIRRRFHAALVKALAEPE